MSGAQESSFVPVNQLLAENAQQLANYYAPARNQLFLDQGQQQIAGTELEYMARAAQGLLDLPVEQRAAAYPQAVAELQRIGLAKNAPTAYPGDAAITRIAALGVPSKDLYGQRATVDANTRLIPQVPGAAAAPGTTAAPAAAGGGAAVPRDPNIATIGEQANNPGNISIGVPGSTGYITAADGQKVAVFPDVKTGVAAHAQQLSRYAGQGINTVQDAVAKWVGQSPDKLGPYITAVSKALGVGPTDKIDLSDPRVQRAFILAQQPYESGKSWLNPADVDAGLAMAGTQPYQVASAGATVPVPTGGATPPTTAEQTRGLVVPPGADTSGLSLGPSVAAPAATATTAATAAPAATVPPTQRRSTVPAQPQQVPIVADGLTQENIDTLTKQAGRVTTEQQSNDKRAMQAANRAQQAHYDTLWHQQQEAADKAAANARAEAKAAREAADAADPIQGSGPEAQAERLLHKHVDKILDGTASKEDRRLYALGAQYYLKPRFEEVPDPSDPSKITWRPVPGAMPVGFPHPDYRPGQETTSATPSKPVQLTQSQAEAASYLDRMLPAQEIMLPLDSTALTWAETVKEKAGNFVGYNINSPNYQRLRQAQESFLSAILRKESGAAINADEWKRDAHKYFPMPGDDAETIKQKQNTRQQAIDGNIRQAGPSYKPSKSAAPSAAPPSDVTKYDSGTGNRITK